MTCLNKKFLSLCTDNRNNIFIVIRTGTLVILNIYKVKCTEIFLSLDWRSCANNIAVYKTKAYADNIRVLQNKNVLKLE